MTTPAGWYDDPEDSGGQRYWDGQSWTPHRQRKPVSASSAAPASPPPSTPMPNVSPPVAPPPPPPPNQQAAWQPPGQQPAGPSPARSNNPIVIIGLILAIAVMAGGAFFAYKHFSKSHPSSPEDQIKALIQHEADDYNNSNFVYNADMYCKANASDDKAAAKKLRQMRSQTGKITISVSGVHVTGDQATADATLKFEKVPGKAVPDNMQFVKEDGRWKDCTPADTSDTGDTGDTGDGQ